MRQLALLAMFLGMPVLSLAQTNQNSWDALNLRAGQKIEVFETNLKNHKGTFSAVTGEAIQLREGESDVAIPRQHVMRVTLLEKSHRLRNAFIYEGVGAGTGAGISAAATRCSTSPKMPGVGVESVWQLDFWLSGPQYVGMGLIDDLDILCTKTSCHTDSGVVPSWRVT